MKRLHIFLVTGLALLVVVGATGVRRLTLRNVRDSGKEGILLQSPKPSLSDKAAKDSPTSSVESRLDQKTQAGFAALKMGNWKAAQAGFEEAIKVFEQKPSTSPWLFRKFSLPASKSVITVNGKAKNVSAEVDDYRYVRGTEQALSEFAAFSAQLAGDESNGQKYLDKVDEMRGVMWGKSWIELVPQIHRLFISHVTANDSEQFGKYLLMAGRLLLDAEDSTGLDLIRQAKHNLPKDATVPALIASHLIVNLDASGAKSEAQASLALNPSQPAVLVDLATAEWMLGELEAAVNAARKAAEFDPELPGPHAALAFVALETGDNSLAVREAELGDKLSHGHAFYKTILAVSIAASGDRPRAERLMKEGWAGGSPKEKQLTAWFFRGKALQYARLFMKESR